MRTRLPRIPSGSSGSDDFCLGEFRDAKIQHLDAITTETVWLQPDVVRFQIAMNDALLVGFMYGRANLFQNVYRPVERQALFFGEHVAERATIEILHHQISDALFAGSGKTKVGDVYDIRMAQAARRARFALEAFHKFRVAHELRRDQFQRDISLCAEMRGQIHRAHPALSEQALQAVLFIKYLTDVTFQAVHLEIKTIATKRHKKRKTISSDHPANC